MKPENKARGEINPAAKTQTIIKIKNKNVSKKKLFFFSSKK